MTPNDLTELAEGVGLEVRHGGLVMPQTQYWHPLDWLLTPAGMVWLLEWLRKNTARMVIVFDNSHGDSVWACDTWQDSSRGRRWFGESTGTTPMQAVARATLAVVRAGKGERHG